MLLSFSLLGRKAFRCSPFAERDPLPAICEDASRDTAAIKLNYSPETIGRHERGDVPVSPDDIIRYAEGYQRPDIMLRYCASCPVGKKTGKRAVDRDLPWAALRVSQRLQKAKEIADKLESIADDGIVDHMERADFDTALAFPLQRGGSFPSLGSSPREAYR